MANKLLLKKSSVTSKVPVVADLDYGELALNYADGKLYFKNSSNVIKSFTIDDSVVTLTGTQTLTNKTLTSPTISGGTINNAVIGGTTAAAGTFTSTNTNTLSVNGAAGDEGGEIILAKAVTNTTLSGSVTIDVYQNKLRIFETGGTTRGVYIDLSAAAAGVATNLAAGGGTVTSVGGTGTVSGLTLTGTVTTSGNLTLGGTLAVTASNFASQTANTFLAAPNGSAGTPTFRTIVAADVPTLNQNTTGSAATLTTARTINGSSFDGSANIVVPLLYDTNYRRITNPGGAEYTTSTSTITGAIAVTLPVGYTNTMVRMTVKVYEYATNESFEIHCGGYNYSPGTTWANNPFAYIVGNPSIDRRFTVRFGYDSTLTKAIIYIGELASTWSYPQVFVTDVQLGYSGNAISWTTGWSVGFEATAFQNVTATITNSQVGYATSTNTANAAVLRDASGNFSAGTITASLTGNATNVTGTVAVANGGTGLTSYTANGVLYASGTGTLASGSGLTFDGTNLSVTGSFIGPGTGLTGTATSLSIGGNAATATSASNIDGIAFNNSNSSNPVSAPDSLDSNGIGYVTSISLLGQTDGALYSQAYSSSWQHQIYGDYRTGQMAVRGKNSGTWQSWRTVLDSTNWSSYVTTGATITDDTSTNATRYLLFDDVTTGSASTVGVSSTKLYFNPSTGTLSATNFNSLSDAKLKQNIQQLEQVDALAIVDQLNPVSFEWIDNNQKSFGVIAQEIESILPEIVDTNADTGIKTVSYMQLVPILIQAVKQLTEQINLLKAAAAK